jgi:ABC-type phosphate transport system substrate-binding protein
LSRALLFVLVLTGLAGVTQPSPATAGSRFRIIVNHDVKGARISRGVLSSIFLKQSPRWGDGSRALPVDQSVRSEVRQTFTGDVLLQGVAEVQIYWQRRMSSGVTPPPVKTSDQEVAEFVAATPGAIGYVSVGAPLPEGVKAVELVD